MDPNTFAYLILGLWPLIGIGLFQWLPPARAFLANLFLSYLFLPPFPTQFDLPLLPPLDKDTLPAFTMLAALLSARMRDHLAQHPLLPQSVVLRMVLLIFVLSPVLTVIVNTDAQFTGRVGLPGLGLRDAISLVLTRLVMVVPMVMAYSLLRREDDLREMLIAFALFGLIYSLPMLLEIRLSPQLNNWIYGFYQHLFDQAIRFGGFRPVVFLYHGIWVAFFTMTAMVAAATLARHQSGPQRARAIVVSLYLFAVLVLCKSVGALLFALLLLPLVLGLSVRLQVAVATTVALVALAYPLLKGAGLLPEQALLDLFSRISPERAASLQFRLNNEAILLERANERPLLGWGSWGRNQVFNPITGRETISDGRWIIALGFYGWLGFGAEMLLLAAPILVLFWRFGALQAAGISPLSGAIALTLAINILDLLPNATLTPLTWLLTGALLGHCEHITQRGPRAEGSASAAQHEPRKKGLQSVI